MTRCSKCKNGNLVNVGSEKKPFWMMECNAMKKPEYINLMEAEKEDLPCDLYEPNLCDDNAA